MSLGRWMVGGVVFISSIAVVRSAAAELPDDPRGILVGVRSAYGAPFGGLSAAVTNSASASSSTPLSDTVTGQIPIWVDAGWRFDRHWSAVAFFSYGFGLVPTNVCSQLTCSVTDLRFGAEARYSFAASKILDPWVGLGTGYEMLSPSMSGLLHGTALDTTAHITGPEIFHLSAGADWWVADSVNIGPMVSFAVADYVSASTGSGSVANFPSSIHEWLFLGLGGQVDLLVGRSKARTPPPPVEAAPDAPTAPAPQAPAPPPPPRAPRPPPAPSMAPPPPVIAPIPAAPPPTAPLAPAPGPSPAPAPVATAPQGWPAGVPIASRTQCSLTCVDGAGLGVETSRVHKPMRRQLGAFRACTLGGGGREAERQILIQFGAGGAATVRYDTSTRHTAGLAECVDRIPLPALAGPPGERWRCSDHCD